MSMYDIVKEKRKMKRTTITLPEDLYEKLEALRRKERRDRSKQIQIILEKHFETSKQEK